MLKKLGLKVITLLVLLSMFSGCFNSKTESGDTGKGVKLQRTSEGLKVIAEENFVGGEYVIDKSIVSDNVNAGENKLSIVTKIENGKSIVSKTVLQKQQWKKVI